MRPDDINPRTGLVVALVSVFLVFGFMFTVSGMKGETLGNIPLLAIGPAICLPGIAAIALARKTEGCTKWPENELLWVRKLPCFRKPKDKEVVELLRTPSDLESGKGSSDELAKKAGLRGKPPCQGQTEVAVASSITTPHTHGRRTPEPGPERASGGDIQIPGWLLSLRQFPCLQCLGCQVLSLGQI